MASSEGGRRIVKTPYNDMGYITILSILRYIPLINRFFGVILRYSGFW